MMWGSISVFVFLFLGNIFLVNKYDKDKLDVFSTILIIIVLWIGCSAISHFVGKRYTWQQNSIKKTIALASAIVILIILVAFFFDILPSYAHGIKINIQELKLNILVMILISFGITSIAEAKDILESWKNSIIKTNRLEKENLEAQFNVLRNQIDPHFLFNSLNTLASYVQDNKEANEYIKNLSEFLRYTLIRKEDNIILISEELNLLNQYIFLQRARFKESLVVNIEIPSIIKEMGYVPPFSIQILMENAVKHNIISKAKPLTVNIFLNEENNLVIENNIQKKTSQASMKVGLTNIVERYMHIAGQKVKIEKDDKTFRVYLPILDYKANRLIF